ncbi:hypothetical protein Bca52824_026927 [Brassica carinata]|uniref:Uncharacterized protein n=1 Tax=Brassica carinata TaxID=52824 RepID=A0A8X7SLD1_BRACI|nr:hypothetical protein Bca52824_026927 [Brassica carinata]
METSIVLSIRIWIRFGELIDDTLAAAPTPNRDENGDLHDPEGHLRNVAGQKIDGKGAVIPEPSPATEDAKVL